MKKAWIWVLVIVLVVVLGYLSSNKIESLYSGVYKTTSPLASSPSVVSVTSTNVITTKSGTKGNYLVGASGMTLYVFDVDISGVSNCLAGCAGVWPPYTVSPVPTNLPSGVATITRDDGKTQFTYKDRPLYYYAGDTQIGDLNGDGVEGTWHLVKP